MLLICRHSTDYIIISFCLFQFVMSLNKWDNFFLLSLFTLSYLQRGIHLTIWLMEIRTFLFLVHFIFIFSFSFSFTFHNITNKTNKLIIYQKHRMNWFLWLKLNFQLSVKKGIDVIKQMKLIACSSLINLILQNVYLKWQDL